MAYTHPKEMIDRPCPNKWSECACCKHESDCRAGLYKGEEATIIAAEIADKVVIAEAKESAHKIKQTWQEELLQQSSKEIFNWMGKWRVPSNLHTVEPYKAMSGPTSPGGSGVKGNKKEKKGTKPTIYKWGSIL